MLRIAISQRERYFESINEVQDSLDQRWSEFIIKLNAIPIIIPNNLEVTELIIDKLKIDGIILSGGDNIKQITRTSTKRDCVENFLYEKAIKNNIPLVGVCRGAEFLLSKQDINLSKIANHTNVEHKIFGMFCETVNSYHDYGVTFSQVADNNNIVILAYTEDKVIELFELKNIRILGLMWHPERSRGNASRISVRLFNNFFRRKKYESYNFGSRYGFKNEINDKE